MEDLFLTEEIEEINFGGERVKLIYKTGILDLKLMLTQIPRRGRGSGRGRGRGRVVWQRADVAIIDLLFLEQEANYCHTRCQ